jgi:hypothetical protein
MKTRKVNALVSLTAAALTWPGALAAAPRPEERPPASAEFPGKPTGSIALEHRLGARPAVGEPLEITITARVGTAFGALAIDADATRPDAVLVAPPVLVEAGDGRYRWTITVVPLAVDAGYLNVLVSGVADGVPQARAVTISLRVAAPERAAPAADGSERLIELPVEESP